MSEREPAAPDEDDSAPVSDRRRTTRTRYPGIYAREGGGYVVMYRDPGGRQRKKTARTLAEARAHQSAIKADLARGEFRRDSGVTFVDYARAWIESYQGRTSRGFRETTRADYRRELELFAYPFLGRMRLAEIEARHVRELAVRVADGGRRSQNTVRLALAPVKALLATAHEEGLIRTNPARGLRIAQASPAATAPGDDRVKALSAEELQRLIEATEPGWRLLVELLAHTGLRISEATGLEWRDVDLEGRRLQVRRRRYRGESAGPKSRFGLRTIPLSAGLAGRLAEHRAESEFPADTAPVFASRRGTPHETRNLYGRVLKPAARRAGLDWVGFHTLRHTCATLLFTSGGANAKQVQMWLGHHSPAFTLATYVHLLPEDLPDPAFLDRITGTAAEDQPRSGGRAG
jgi:integrase